LNTLFLLKVFEEIVNIASLLFKDLLGAIQYSHFSLDLVKCFLHLLELIVLNPEIGSVLSEIITLHVLLSFLLEVLILFVTELLLVGDLLDFELLHLFHLLFLLFGNTVSL
jgi:hypothetical protein